MAFQTGTATDYKNLLSILRTFALANGWTEDRYAQGAEDELIIHGDGDASDEIYIGIDTYSDSGPGYYNWALRGFTGYDSGVDWSSQPGTSSSTYIPLRDSTIDYWLFINGRRICMIAKTGSSYQFMYAGFIDTYSTDAEWPYPLMVMGSSGNATTVFNSNEISYSSSINPGFTIGGGSPAYIRFVDGTWFPIYNFTRISSSETHSLSGNKVSVWPQCNNNPNYTNGSDESFFIYNNSFRELFCSETQGGSPETLLFRTENDAAEAVVPLIPLVLLMVNPSGQLLGEMHNVYWSTFTNGITSEDTVTDGVSSDTYLIFQNIHRTDPWCGVAIKEE